MFGEWRRAWSFEVAGVEASVAFAIIDDVETYPHFLPAIRRANVVGEDNGDRLVENSFLIGPVALDFRSRATRRPPWGLTVTSRDGPWRQFSLEWRVEPSGNGVVAHGAARLDFRSLAMSTMARLAWPEIERQTCDAFARRMRGAANGGCR